jgi:hypothetical protein
MVTVGDITRSEPVLVGAGATVRHLVPGREEPGGEGGAHGHCWRHHQVRGQWRPPVVDVYLTFREQIFFFLNLGLI